MRLCSREHREPSENASTVMELAVAALLFSAMGAGSVPAHAATQEIAADVGHVEDVRGRVVAFSQGKPTLLDALDVISDRTRLDLQANSELRLCHYPTSKLVTLKGPLRASITRDGVTVENSKVVVAATGSCVAPVVSTFQGGIVSRGTGVKTANVPLQATRLADLMNVLSSVPSKSNIVILDACRNNPFSAINKTAGRDDKGPFGGPLGGSLAEGVEVQERARSL
jgi:hypothetical protein